MKTLLGSAAASALIAFGMPGAALAAPITFIDTWTPAPHVCLSVSAPTACEGGAASVASRSFTLDVTLDGFAPGSPVTGAELVLDLSDDGGMADGNEKLGLLVDGASIPYTQNANHDAVITLADFTSLDDGKLVVVLSATTGDFFLDGARLTVVDDPTPAAAAAVPVPAALVLLGTGLAGAVWRRRAAR